MIAALLLAQAFAAQGDSLTLPAALRLARENRGVLPAAAAARAFAGVRRGRVPFPSVHMAVEWDDPSLVTQRSYLSFAIALPFPLWNLGNGQVAAARGVADRAAALALETALDLDRLNLFVMPALYLRFGKRRD